MTEARNLSRRLLDRLTNPGIMFCYLYCLIASYVIIGTPLYGGALYLCGRVAVIFFSTYAGVERTLFPKPMRRGRTILLAILMLSLLTLLFFYPISENTSSPWIPFAIVLSMIASDDLGQRLVRAHINGLVNQKWFRLGLVFLHLTPNLALAVIFLCTLSLAPALLLFGGFLACDLLILYHQMVLLQHGMTRDQQPVSSEDLVSLHTAMKQANAYRVYELLSALVSIAVVFTTELLFTYLIFFAHAPSQIFFNLAVGVSVSLLFYGLASLGLRWREKRLHHYSDSSYVLIVGLILWLDGLLVLRNFHPASPELWRLLWCAALTSAGSSLCMTCLGWLETGMDAVARYTLPNDAAIQDYRRLRSASIDLAILIGQTLSLAVLTAAGWFNGMFLTSGKSFYALPHILIVVPGLLIIVGALIAVFRFPLSSRILRKLSRFLKLQETGSDNAALREQLDGYVVRKRHRPFGTQSLKFILRLFLRHRLIHADRLKTDDNNPFVLLCNHGQIYGPLAAVINMPVPIRTWTISHMCENVDEVAAYLLHYTVEPKAWIPERLKKPTARALARLSVWCMRELEAIPVYRDTPMQLSKTFRASVAALQAGDNLLIFPENPNAVEQDHGYEREGVGELFSGFAMLAQIYYKRTHKRCRFVPMYAHKGARVLLFGQEIVFDPSNDPAAERQRISDEALAEMRRLCEEGTEIAAEKNKR